MVRGHLAVMNPCRCTVGRPCKSSFTACCHHLIPSIHIALCPKPSCDKIKSLQCYIASLTLSVAVKFRIIETEPNLLARVYLYLPNKLDPGHRQVLPQYNIICIICLRSTWNKSTGAPCTMDAPRNWRGMQGNQSQSLCIPTEDTRRDDAWS